MVFSSMLFVLLFLAANLAAQAFVKDIKKKNAVMLAFSLVFYAWAGVRYVALLLGLTWVCWVCALLMEHIADRHRKKCVLTVCVVLVLATLGVFKYTGFFLENIRWVTGWPQSVPQIALPIGLSFYSFQLISYVIDVYRRETAAQQKYWLLLLYAGLFHQCVAGPIVRYSDVNDDILHRRVKGGEVSQGISRFCVGLAKKAVLANGCAALADSLLLYTEQGVAAASVAGLWLGAAVYALQIYLDFSAYSDMAIGMGLMCGFHYKENFNYPYIARSLTDFWKRWHISLTGWFRSYVYMPMAISKSLRKLYKKWVGKYGRQKANKLSILIPMATVWLLTGLWHGAAWSYVLWGVWHGLWCALEGVGLIPANRPDKNSGARLLGHIYTLFVVLVGVILFRYEDFSVLGTAMKGLIGANGNVLLDYSTRLTLKNNLFFLLFCCVASTPLFKTLSTKLRKVEKRNYLSRLFGGTWEVLCPVLLLAVSMMALAGNSYNPFLYFRF